MITKASRKAVFHNALAAVADVMTKMQVVRQNLLHEGTTGGMLGTKEGNDIIALAQVLEDGKERMKKRFTELTLE